jgi:glycosyltransferase involved in cell wall biosynthesis
MKIALGVPSDLGKTSYSGFNVAFQQVLSALSGHETIVFAPGGGDIRLHAEPVDTGFKSRYLNTMALSKDFAERVTRFSPDVILAFTNMGLFLDRDFIYYTSNVPYKRVLQLVAGEYPENTHFSALLNHYKFVAGQEAENYEKAEHIVVLSHMIREAIVTEHGIDPDKITYLPRYIPKLQDQPIYMPSRSEFPHSRSSSRKMQIILMPAQLRVMKGIRYAVETMKILKKEMNNAVLVICGSFNAYEHDYVKSLLHDAKGKANIVVTGYLPRDKYYGYLRNAECAFMPFCFDECPISLSECIGSGLPVVTNEYAGYSEPVINTFGYCADYKNVEDYADALMKMLSDREYNRVKRDGCRTITEAFSLDKFRENLQRVVTRSGKA